MPSLTEARPGRCLTILIALELGTQDPAVGLSMAVIEAWRDIWRRYHDLHRRVAKAWQTSYQRCKQIRPNARWRRVAGPLAAVQVTLMGLGWDPRRPDLWIDAAQCEWAMQAGRREVLDFLRDQGGIGRSRRSAALAGSSGP